MSALARFMLYMLTYGLRRTKFSHDPNNTAWSRSTTGYGQKIMLSQGWSPGEFLGAKDAPHASLYSQSSASHIRVTLKDDNLGLGARRGAPAGDVQCTGLDIFQDVLGRLNGKDQTDIDAEQKSRADLRRAIHVERRWGSLRFVSGGLLVGARIQKAVKDGGHHAPAPENALLHPSPIPAVLEPNEEVTKPRHQNSILELPSLSNTKMPKRVKKSKTPRSPDSTIDSDIEIFVLEGGNSGITPSTDLERNSPIENESRQQDLSKAQRRAEKTKRKLQRKLRREAKKAIRAEQDVEALDVATTPLPQQSLSLYIAEHTSRPTAGVANHRDVSTRYGTVGGRHAVRQRYIRHKRMAITDTKALNEVRYTQSPSSNPWKRS